jgi:hypothetical protein
MIITNYQITEIMMGTLLFPIIYFIYIYLSSSDIIVWDIIWCTVVLFIALLFKYFYINYNLLQSQNFILTI